MSGRKYEVHLKIKPPKNVELPKGTILDAVLHIADGDVQLAGGFIGGDAIDSIDATERLAQIGLAVIRLIHTGVLEAKPQTFPRRDISGQLNRTLERDR